MSTDRKNHLLRYLSGAICFLLLFAAPIYSMADYIQIKGSVVNVRQGPGTSHPVLFQAEQGEQFDLISTEGLWCLVKLQTGQEAWVFRKLVDIVQGDRPGAAAAENKAGKPEQDPGGSATTELVIILFAFLIISVGIWKRKGIARYSGLKLREISGYKREQAFRYDNRKPSDDSWEI